MPLESFLQDVRIGVRVLAKDRSFCFLAVLVLGLGICGVTTQFAIVNAFVLRGFSFPHSEELMSVGLINPQGSAQQNNLGIGNVPSLQDYEDLRSVQGSFAQLVAYVNGISINVSVGGVAHRYTGAYVTEDFFKILGVAPILGRDFTANDNEREAEASAILSHDIWRRDFNGDPNTIGQTVRINGRAGRVIGVMPAGFNF